MICDFVSLIMCTSWRLVSLRNLRTIAICGCCSVEGVSVLKINYFCIQVSSSFIFFFVFLFCSLGNRQKKLSNLPYRFNLINFILYCAIFFATAGAVAAAATVIAIVVDVVVVSQQRRKKSLPNLLLSSS